MKTIWVQKVRIDSTDYYIEKMEFYYIKRKSIERSTVVDKLNYFVLRRIV